jgi:hypothetical protein
MYYLLREEDDWSFLADPVMRKDFWDPIKYILLRSARNDWFLFVGGDARKVWEQIGNDNWGQQPFMNGYFNERYMLISNEEAIERCGEARAEPSA